MKKIAILFLLIVTINAQKNDVLKSKYGLGDFDDPPFENIKTEKSFAKIPALLKSSIANSNPEFLSTSTDSVYEDSTYLFNALTNDPDANSVSVSVTSNPSWLALTAMDGGGISNVTKYWLKVVLSAESKANETITGSSAGIAFDSNGNLYFSVYDNSIIYKIDINGIISAFAGTGTAGYSGDGGAATDAQINHPAGMEFDSNGNLYFADASNHCIRKIDTSGNISTFAGTGGESGFSGDGGAATSAKLNFPYRVTFDSNGNLYIPDVNNHRIRKVDTNGNISTFAGTGESGFSGDGGAAASAKLSGPTGVTFDSNGNLYISSYNNHVIRKVDTNGNISTFAGTGTEGYSGDGGAATSAQLSQPWGVNVDASGNVYIADSENHRIRKVDTNGNISTFAGTGTEGFSGDGGAATSAKLNSSEYIIYYNNNYYIADYGNARIRKIDSNGIITTIAGKDVYNGDNISASTAKINLPRNMAMDKNDNLYIAEQNSNRIRKIDSNGIITTVAGTGEAGYSGDGGAATSAKINAPRGVAVDNAGNIYISDRSNNRIRKVDADGIITTYAGNGESGYSGDDGAATSAKINFPYSLATDSNGNLYISDAYNHIIRKVDSSGKISTVAGTPESSGYSGDGGAATSAQLNSPLGVDLDSNGNIYIADIYNDRIRKVDTNGIISTVAGTGESGYTGDGAAATSATISSPITVRVDEADNIYIAQWSSNPAIRKIWKGSGIITTVAGTGTVGYTTDTTAIHALLTSPLGMALDSKGNLFFGEQGNKIIRKVNASYHTLTGTPTNSDVGTTTMTLTASDGQGGSATQSFTLKVIDPTAPATPTGLAATPGNTQEVLTWTANSESDLASYKVYGGTSASNNTLLSTITAGTETYTHNSLTNGTTYYYSITAVDNSGNESSKTSYVSSAPHPSGADYIALSGNLLQPNQSHVGVLKTVPDIGGYSISFTDGTGSDHNSLFELSGDSLNLKSAHSSSQTVYNVRLKFENPNYTVIDTPFTIYGLGTAPSVSMEKWYGGSDHDYAYSLYRDDDGNFIITGRSYSFSDSRDAYIVKVNEEGDTLWTKVIDGTGKYGITLANGTAQDSAGNYITSLYYNDSNGSDYTPISLDKNGNKIWEKSLGVSSYGARELVIVNNNIYITGYDTLSDGDNTRDGILVKLDSEGNKQWSKSFDYGKSEYLWGILEKNNFLYLMGSVHNAPYENFWEHNGLIIKTDLDGNQIWKNEYDFGGHQDFEVMRFDNEGYIYFTGRTQKDTLDASSNDAFLAKIDTLGELQWVKKYNTLGTDYALELEILPNGYPIITIQDKIDDTNRANEGILLLNSDGVPQWYSILGKQGYDDYIWGLEYDNKGNIFTVATSYNNSDYADFHFKKIANVFNVAPALSQIADITINEDSSVKVIITAVDYNGDSFSLSAKSSSNNITLSISDDSLSIVPNSNWNGTSTISVYATDGVLVDTSSFTFTVTAVNDAPVITAVANDSTNEETEKTIVLSTTNVDGDALTYSASSDTSAVGLTISSDTLKLNPALNYTGTAKITVITDVPV